MEELVADGLVRNIGVSNLGINGLRHVLDGCNIRPHVLEVEMHPHLAQPKLLRFCQDEGINVVAYSPLGKVTYHFASRVCFLGVPA